MRKKYLLGLSKAPLREKLTTANHTIQQLKDKMKHI
jgi:hypothetical protein